MHTFFAGPEKATPAQFNGQLEFIQSDPILTTLLSQIGGVVAILNDTRQVLAINTYFLEFLGIASAEKALGLRVGEIIDCENAKLEPGGCGTSKLCATCGAAIAMVTCQSEKRPIEQFCSIRSTKGGKISDIYLKVQASCIQTSNGAFTLLLIQDITHHQFLLNLEQTFLHDASNLLQSLHSRCHLLTKSSPARAKDLAQEILQISNRLSSEFAIQKLLKKESYDSYRVTLSKIDTEDLLNELEITFGNHPHAYAKRIKINNMAAKAKIDSDYSLLFRILGNMVVNALEASEDGDTVKVTAIRKDNAVKFSVWNRQVISEKNKTRIFQRNFTTKGKLGHGLGCFSMKLFGEKCLHAEVDFSSKPDEGTLFWIKMPTTNPLPN